MPSLNQRVLPCLSGFSLSAWEDPLVSIPTRFVLILLKLTCGWQATSGQCLGDTALGPSYSSLTVIPPHFAPAALALTHLVGQHLLSIWEIRSLLGSERSQGFHLPVFRASLG